MNIDNQIHFYDKRWSEKGKLNTLKLLRSVKMLEYFVVVKRKIKKPRVLDLGCGDGRFTAFLGEFGHADGIELSKEAVNHANQNYPHVNFFHGDALTYPFESESYDVIFSQEVIEHVENQDLYLKVCFDALKQGGYLIMTTPNKRVFDRLKGGNWSNQPIENILTPKSLKSLVSKRFKILCYDSIIFNFGKQGYLSIVNHRIIIGAFNKLGLKMIRERILSKLGFGIHQCVLAVKK